MAGVIGNATELKAGLMPTNSFLSNRSVSGYASADDMFVNGTYRFNGESISYLPQKWGSLIVFAVSNETIIQLFIVANESKTFIRHRWYSTWSDWSQLN